MNTQVDYFARMLNKSSRSHGSAAYYIFIQLSFPVISYRFPLIELSILIVCS
nr:hypothetical protein [Paenibacillus xylanexedens]